MDWVSRIRSIKERLSSNGFNQLSKEVEDAQMVLGTSGEMFLSTVTKLKEIKQHHKKAYSLIENDVEAIFSYGKSINYLSDDY